MEILRFGVNFSKAVALILRILFPFSDIMEPATS